MEPLRQVDLSEAASTDETRLSDVPPVPPSPAGETRKTSTSPEAATVASGDGRTMDGRDLELSDTPAAFFPGYSVVREIHRGGQGVVYLAVQESTRQKVAIKVMREGPFASASDLARFEREVHILAQLHHPNIVSIIDSQAARGHCFFVMDYISGQPLDEYIRTHAPALRPTLELFATICDAVNAAHVRGIIHRDLKPSNIRVDTEGVPHILDFGLAKTLTAESDASAMTVTGQFMGSLPWASPEQAEALPSKIDVRTDVYSLGVILYQMLTGKFPYDVVGSMRDVLDRIIRVEPAPPSRVGSIVTRGSRRPRSLIRPWSGRSSSAAIDNEVETIVLKCLQKERDRRYQSAGELARDVRRYLAGEPIDAKRDSAWYLLAKTLRRHRAAAGAGFAAVLMLAAFSVAMTFAYGRVEEQRRKAESVAGFLDQMLVLIDPELARESTDTPLYQALRDTVARAERNADALVADPDVQARVQQAIGRSYLNLGLYEAAATNLRRAWETRRRLQGPRALETAEAEHNLAWALKELACFDEAETLYREALAVRREMLGAQHAAVAETLNGLGQLYFERKDYGQAERFLREALTLRQQLGDAVATAASLANVGSLLRDTGRLPEAEALLCEALALRQRTLGAHHFHTLVSMNKLGLLARERGALDEAQRLFAAVLEQRLALFGNMHPQVAVSANNLALTLFDAGQYQPAAQYFSDAVNIWRQQLGAQHPRVARGLCNLAGAEIELGAVQNAHANIEAALKILPPDSAERATALGLLGRLRLRQDDPAAAEPALREALAAVARTAGDGRASAILESELGECLVRLRHTDEGLVALDRGHARLKELLGDEHRETRRAAERLAAAGEARGASRGAEE